MELVFHGGKCCGIKTIYSLGTKPEELCSELFAIPLNNSDCAITGGPPGKRFFHHAAPAESYLARLDRYLEYLAERRPSGICEIVLADYACYDNFPASMNQNQIWQSHLLDRGFILVNQNLNSNSKNNVYVYHKNFEAGV